MPELYKITMYDQNCCPICDGVTFWFTEDLEDFEENWLPIESKVDVLRIDRYYRSKHGENVTDYYTDDPKYNIVQSADSEVLDKKEFSFTDKTVTLNNVYGCETVVEFDKLFITLRNIRYSDQFFLVGQYRGYGCRRVDPTWNRWYNKQTKYTQMHFFGNTVANYVARTVDWDDTYKDDAYKDFYTDDKNFFRDEKVETFVWLPIKETNSQYKIKPLTDKEIALLMADIVGEAG